MVAMSPLALAARMPEAPAHTEATDAAQARPALGYSTSPSRLARASADGADLLRSEYLAYFALTLYTLHPGILYDYLRASGQHIGERAGVERSRGRELNREYDAKPPLGEGASVLGIPSPSTRCDDSGVMTVPFVLTSRRRPSRCVTRNSVPQSASARLRLLRITRSESCRENTAWGFSEMMNMTSPGVKPGT